MTSHDDPTTPIAYGDHFPPEFYAITLDCTAVTGMHGSQYVSMNSSPAGLQCASSAAAGVLCPGKCMACVIVSGNWNAINRQTAQSLVCIHGDIMLKVGRRHTHLTWMPERTSERTLWCGVLWKKKNVRPRSLKLPRSIKRVPDAAPQNSYR